MLMFISMITDFTCLMAGSGSWVLDQTVIGIKFYEEEINCLLREMAYGNCTDTDREFIMGRIGQLRRAQRVKQHFADMIKRSLEIPEVVGRTRLVVPGRKYRDEDIKPSANGS